MCAVVIDDRGAGGGAVLCANTNLFLKRYVLKTFCVRVLARLNASSQVTTNTTTAMFMW